MPTRKPPKLRHAPASERPPLRSQSRQIAHVPAPPSVRVQQSPQTSARQDAQGPTASAEQKVHRSGPGSAVWSAPLTPPS